MQVDFTKSRLIAMKKEFLTHVKEEKTDFEDLTKIEKETMPAMDPSNLSFLGGQLGNKDEALD